MNNPATSAPVTIEPEKKTSAAVMLLKGVVLLLVIGLAAAAVTACLLYTKYVSVEDGTWIIDLTGTKDVAQSDVEWLEERFPNADVRYMVELGGLRVENTVTDLTLTDAQEVAPDRLVEAASQLPGIVRLNLTGLSVSVEQYEAIRAAYPEAEVNWIVPVALGGGLTADAIVVRPADVAQLRELATVLDYLPNLEQIDMTHAELTDAELAELEGMALQLEPQGIRLTWLITAAGQRYARDTTEVTLSGAYDASDLAELQRLPCLASVTLDGIQTSDLSPLVSITTLESITIRNMDVDDITVLGQMKWLGSVFVKNTNVTWAQLNRLQEQLPECIIMKFE